MRILAVADVEEGWLESRLLRERLGRVDLVVSCGDLRPVYLENVVTFANAPLAYVRGNHDAGASWHAPEGCVDLEGEVRDCRGLHLGGLGGSIRYNERVFGFSEDEMHRRAARMALLSQSVGGLDVMVTHAPPRGYGDLEDFVHQGFEALNVLLERTRPRYLLHGHVHLDYGRIPRVVEHPLGTTIVNVCGSYVLDLPEDEVPTQRRGILRAEPL